MAFLVGGIEVVDNSRSIDAAGISTFESLRATGVVTSLNMEVTGIATVASLEAVETAIFDSEDSGTKGLQFGTAGIAVTTVIASSGVPAAPALDNATALDAQLPSAKAVTEYVARQIAETGGTLELVGDSGTTTDVDLSNGTLTFNGTPNQLAFTGDNLDGTDNGVFTVALDAALQLPGTLAFSAQPTKTIDAVVNSTDTIAANSNDTSIPTTAAVTAAIADAAGGGSAAAATINLQEDFTTATELAIPFADVSGGDGQKSLFYADEAGTSKLTFIPSQGRLNAQEFNSLSDIRYKENIELIENPMAKIEALRGVTYDWKNNGNASAGIIAQEVKAVMPELISETEERMTVNYNGLTGLLIEAVKELSAEVAALKAAQ